MSEKFNSVKKEVKAIENKIKSKYRIDKKEKRLIYSFMVPLLLLTIKRAETKEGKQIDLSVVLGKLDLFLDEIFSILKIKLK